MRLASLALLVLAAPLYAASPDPPPVVCADPPPLVKRVSDLEVRMAALESKFGVKSACPNCTGCVNGCNCVGGGSFCKNQACSTTSPLVARAAPVETFQLAPSVRAAVGHTHTCANGHTWDHTVTAGHNCPVCGLPQYVQDSRPRMVNTAGGAVRATPVAAPSSFSSETFQSYSLGGCSAGGCAGGSCSAASGARWHPGKLLGR